MDEFDDSEDDGLQELVERFKSAVEEGQSIYFDQDEYQDVIGYLLDGLEFTYAQKAIAMAVQQYPNDPFFRLLRAKCYAMQEDFVSAERELNYLENHYEPMPEVYVERVLLARSCNRDVDAKLLLNKALSIDENIPEVHLLLAHEYISDRNIPQAVHHAIRAIQLDSMAAEDLKVVTIDFHNIHHSQKNDLVAFFMAMTDEMPMCASLWSGLGIAYMNNDQFDQASEAFEFQISLDSDDPIAYVNLAESKFESGKYRDAVKNFKIANAKCEVVQFNIQIGRCYYRMQDYDNAMKYFTKAHQDDPLFNFVILDIVNVFKAQGRFDEARTYLRDYLKKQPDDMDAIESLIELLSSEKDEEEIRDLCFAALHQSHPITYSFLFFFSCHRYRISAPDLAIEICKEYMEDEDLHPSIHYFLAALYIRKEMMAEGCRLLEYALSHNTDKLDMDFLEIDDLLADIPEVAELIRIYCSDSDIDMLN